MVTYLGVASWFFDDVKSFFFQQLFGVIIILNLFTVKMIPMIVTISSTVITGTMPSYKTSTLPYQVNCMYNIVIVCNLYNNSVCRRRV
jgi:hypothetical protein